MKVTDIKTFVVDCFRTNWVFVKVYTDEGITGVGEATLEYKEKALLGAVEHIREYLVGKNPLQIEAMHMYCNHRIQGYQEHCFCNMKPFLSITQETLCSYGK